MTYSFRDAEDGAGRLQADCGLLTAFAVLVLGGCSR